ncbi:Nucleolar protein 13, partial [Elasticomyces elasticus]
MSITKKPGTFEDVEVSLGKRKRAQVLTEPIEAIPAQVEAESAKKHRDDQPELEVDLNAPEPPSRKAARKAKRQKVDDTGSADASQDADAPVLVTASNKPELKSEESTNGRQRSEHGVWIGNLGFATTKEDLLKFMTTDTDHPISEVHILQIRLPQGSKKFGKAQNKGFGHVDFTDAAALANARQLSEKLLSGR